MFNRSIICKIANKLRRDGYTLSQAFRMAWKLAKGNAIVKVAGVSKGNRQTAIEHFKHYNTALVTVSLVRENTNTYDSNAIAVYITVGGSKAYKMGYIRASVARLLSGVIDTHHKSKPTSHYGRLL